ncbi:cytochrome P450, putative [Ricinus communis]|uniref:Cytochrome P450, putative n=1 Tax=Ricinus communis TaxID=3988 RepID=B9REA1_RICCO|nr:cytochrome P450, putative [Ricinus communis]|eukprot:XP_002512040.1 cytochrome P450 CYP749A22 [Ricinus communis]
MGTLIIYLSSCTLCLFFLLFLAKFFDKVWWTPIRTQSMLRSQGIRGPCYKIFHGNTKEIISMVNNASSNPAELSHQQLLPTVLPHIYSWIKIYGNNFLTWHGRRAYFVVTEPDLIKEILNGKDGVFPKAEPEHYEQKIFGDGTITSKGEKWVKMRKLSNHAFHAESLKGLIPVMIASVEIMLERWKYHDGKEVEVFQEFEHLTSEVISRTAFGSSYWEGKHIFDMLTRLIIILSKNKYNIRIPGIRNLVKTGDDIESDKLEKNIHDSFINMIKRREEEATMGQADGFGSGFLGLLLKAHHDNNMAKKISVDDLIDECKTFYVAGRETTTSLITWILFLPAIHPDWQHKAREEVIEIFGSQHPRLDGLTRLKIVSMIINETLRLYPPAVIFKRYVQRQVRLGKLILPANIVMEIPILAVHHNPQIWGEDVNLFKPERFAEGVAKATKNNAAAYLPFSLGPRNCVGYNFAITETKIALSIILQRYRFSLSPNYVHSPIPLIGLCPQHGLQIMLHKL